MNRAELIASLQAQIDGIAAGSTTTEHDQQESAAGSLALPREDLQGVGTLQCCSAESHAVLFDAFDMHSTTATSTEYISEGFADRVDKRETSESNSAFKKIVDLVNASDKSEQTIRQRLDRSGFHEEAIDDAVERAKQYGFIDDLRFADVLIRSRIDQGKGFPGIERELKSHNIDPFEIDGWPERFSLDDDNEFDRAMRILERKPPRSKNVRDSAYRKLIQKGYSASVASSVSRTWAERYSS